MQTKIILGIICTLYLFLQQTYCQEKVEVDASIKLGYTDDPTISAGTVRWSGANFEFFNGIDWIDMAFQGGLKDIDNNYYKVVQIGNQTWMAENLRVTRFNNGSSISLVTDDMDWSNTTNAWTWYKNGTGEKIYGALYNYYIASGTDGLNVCPTGWHVPDTVEWNALINHLGGNSTAGGKMKNAGLAYWYAPNIGASNESGFNALPAGIRSMSGQFSSAGVSGCWWTSDAHSNTHSPCYCISQEQELIYDLELPKKSGISIRCIKD